MSQFALSLTAHFCCFALISSASLTVEAPRSSGTGCGVAISNVCFLPLARLLGTEREADWSLSDANYSRLLTQITFNPLKF